MIFYPPFFPKNTVGKSYITAVHQLETKSNERRSQVSLKLLKFVTHFIFFSASRESKIENARYTDHTSLKNTAGFIFSPH